MSAVSMGTHGTSGRRLAGYGAVWGTAVVSGLGVMRVAFEDRPYRPGQLLEDIAGVVVYLAPFVIALLATRLEDGGLQRGIWMGAGVLGLLLSISSFSGATLVLLPGAIMLLLGVRRARAESLAGRSAGSALAAVLVVLIGIGAWFSLQVRTDPRCFVLSRSGGTEFWRQVPDTAPGKGVGVSLGPHYVEGTCGSDVTVWGATLSLGLWLGTMAGGALILFRRPGATLDRATT